MGFLNFRFPNNWDYPLRPALLKGRFHKKSRREVPFLENKVAHGSVKKPSKSTSNRLIRSDIDEGGRTSQLSTFLRLAPADARAVELPLRPTTKHIGINHH